MADANTDSGIDFKVDVSNLYREEGYTDLKVASIRRLIPVLPDGSTDKSRTEIFIGSAQLMSPSGPLPIQSVLTANSLEEAIDAFPEAMRIATEQMVEELRKMQEQQKNENDSRIIVPGR